MTNATKFHFGEMLQISELECLLVANILANHLGDRKVWAFGSRATGLRVKRFSDLDLAVAGRLDFAERAALVEAFDEALINFKVDVIKTDLVDQEFLRRIEPDFLLLQGRSMPAAKTA